MKIEQVCMEISIQEHNVFFKGWEQEFSHLSMSFIILVR